jgi:hypothetical protein
MYSWWDYGPTEFGIERCEDDDKDAMTFTEAKRQLVNSLMATKYAYQEGINAMRALRKDEVAG